MDQGSLMKDLLPGDIVKFGLIPEFVGRLPVIVVLNELSRQALVDVLTKPKNSLLEQYKKMFEMDNLELTFDQTAIEKIADKAIALKTGARGLRTILEASMREIMYKAPSEHNLRKVTITGDVIAGKKANFEYTQSREIPEIEDIQPKAMRSVAASL